MRQGGRRRFLATGAAAGLGALASDAVAAPEGTGQDELKVTRLGWAGLALERGGLTLLVDPLARTTLWGAPIGHLLTPIEIATPSCHALVTHLHGDHFDPDALRAALGERGQVVCAEGVAATVASHGLRVRPLRLWEPYAVGGFTVAPVPAADGFGVEQVSWVVTAGGRRLFHGGDTMWHGAWWEIGRQYGPFDAAFLPINGFRFLGREPDVDVPSSLTPEQAVAAATVLGARRLVPIHYGMATPFYVEEKDAVGRAVERGRAAGVDVVVVSPGARLG
jgi:L-ascorbate metabolism protein UlaG (beta-lactamase superfamily)